MKIDRETLQGFKDCIDNAHHFGATTVAGFTGRIRNKPLTDSLPRYKEIWSELAKRAGVSHTVVSRIEQGEQTPSRRTLERLADALRAAK